MPEPDPLAALFVASFNNDLMALNSSARVVLPSGGTRQPVLELQDEGGNFLCLIPEEASPEMVAIAYRLYATALTRGVAAGEEAAWEKLRFLIGAAAELRD